MSYIVLFTDAPDAPADLRSRHMEAHLAFLASHAELIEAAGPLTDPDKAGRDGLWIVAAKAVEEVEALVRADPFFPTGLRKSWAILPWRRVWSDGARQI